MVDQKFTAVLIHNGKRWTADLLPGTQQPGKFLDQEGLTATQFTVKQNRIVGVKERDRFGSEGG